jgi:general secretion pathway protein A
MYATHFGLSENPFSIAPDPRFLYLSARHREALAHLLYGISAGGGFVQLTGEIGTGKTTLTRCLLEQVPDNVDIALVLNPRVSPLELVAVICDELKIAYTGGTQSLKVLVDALNTYLLDAHARGRRTVVMIDEAQNLSVEALEQVRLLTNLETTTEKLLQIILIGQPELAAHLARPELKQLAQRITARYHLMPLDLDETRAYIRHRLSVAGVTRSLLTARAITQVHHHSGGVPRRINILCDRALLGAYAEDKPHVRGGIVRRAAREVQVQGLRRSWRLAGLVGLLMIVLAGAGWYWAHPVQQESVRPSTLASKPTATQPAPVPDRVTVTPAPAAPAVPPAPAATPQPAPPISPPEPSLGAQLTAQPGGPSAVQALFAHWKLAEGTTTAGDPCLQAVSAGLACLRGSGNWHHLRRLRVPALLTLFDTEGQRNLVLARATREQDITLEWNGESRDLPLSAVEPWWHGDYLLLWKPPALEHRVLHAGIRGDDIRWLRARLDAALGAGAAPDAEDDRFDAALGERVREFQRRMGLTDDGIVGERTQFYLSFTEQP